MVMKGLTLGDDPSKETSKRADRDLIPEGYTRKLGQIFGNLLTEYFLS
jgi:hypothetical protein